ncbi:MAG: hypothetical protein BWY78_00807 [Alphaproteobacteria bacterium ADurb.Bin438]|nr:MAG: hypothetical protein BWY78_00807 [Alphaproteobacteria bacterium ADurb.Bin438]
MADDIESSVNKNPLTKAFLKDKSFKIYFNSSKKSVEDKDIPDIVSAIVNISEKGGAFLIDEKDDTAEFQNSDNLKLDTKASRFVEKLNNKIKSFNDDENYVVFVFNQDKFNEFRANNHEKDKYTSLDKFLKNEFKRQVSDFVVENAYEGISEDAPVTLFGNIVSKRNKQGKASVVIINDFNKDLTKEGYSVNAPDAERIIKEKGITDEMLRLSTAYHEVHHALDNSDYSDLQNNSKNHDMEDEGGFLQELYTGHLMEIKADIGAMVQSFKDNGNFKSSEHDEFVRANNTYSDFTDEVLRKSIMMGNYPSAYDEFSFKVMEESGYTYPNNMEIKFDKIRESSTKYEEINNFASIAAYNTSPLLKKMHNLLMSDEKLLKKVSNMKMKEFNKFVDGFISKNALSKEQFGKLIIDMSNSYYDEKNNLIVPDNKSLIAIINHRDYENQKMGVSKSAVAEYDRSRTFDVMDEVDQEFLGNNSNSFFKEGPEEKLEISDGEFEMVDKWMNTLSRKMEREAIKIGNDNLAFSKVISEEIDNLRNHDDMYSETKLKIIEDFYLGNKEKAKLRVEADKEVRKELDNSPDYIPKEKGIDLVVSYLANQMDKFDVASKALHCIKERDKQSLSLKDKRKNLEDISNAFDEIIVFEKKSVGLAQAITKDNDAKEIISGTNLIQGKVTARSGGRFSSWIRDYLILANQGASDVVAKNLITRLDERKIMLVSEVCKNKKLFKAIEKNNQELATRIGLINNVKEYKGKIFKSYGLKSVRANISQAEFDKQYSCGESLNTDLINKNANKIELRRNFDMRLVLKDKFRQK